MFQYILDFDGELITINLLTIKR